MIPGCRPFIQPSIWRWWTAGSEQRKILPSLCFGGGESGWN